MTQKHQYLKQLYKEWNITKLKNEINEIEKIINDYKIQLMYVIKDENEKNKIINNIKYEENNLKFAKKIKELLLKKIQE